MKKTRIVLVPRAAASENNFNLRWYHCVLLAREIKEFWLLLSVPAGDEIELALFAQSRTHCVCICAQVVHKEKGKEEIIPAAWESVQKGLENTCAPRVCIINMLWNAAFCFVIALWHHPVSTTSPQTSTSAGARRTSVFPPSRLFIPPWAKR